MITDRRIIHFYGILLLIATAVGCQSCSTKAEKSQGVIKAIDSRGENIRLQQPAERIVVLFEPSVDELYMLGAGDQIIGIPEQVYLTKSTYNYLSTLDRRIKQKEIATPTFGGRSSNIESIISLNADLVIAYEQDLETISQLENLGIPVFTVASRTEEKIIKELEGLGILTGKEERAKEIIAYIKKETNAIAQTTPHTKPKTVYYAWSKGRILSTSGKGTLTDMAIELAGAKNACSLNLEAPNIGVEMLYHWDPDIIVLWNSNLEDVYNLKELMHLRAIKNKQVFVMEPSFYYDPHTVKFILFSKQLHSWCYPDEYPVAELNADLEEALTFLYGGRQES